MNAEHSIHTTKPRLLSEELAGLVEAFADRPVTLREVFGVLRGRAYTFFLLLLSLPFCTPIPLPGISTPFGVMIALIGFRLSLGQTPWLPQRLLDTKLPARFFSRLFAGAKRMVRGMERVLRPRLTFLVDQKILHHVYGFMIMLSGLFLLLPLPIPLSNGLPALTVVLLAAALLERDGYFIVAGVLAFTVTLCFFGILVWSGAEVTNWIRGLFMDDSTDPMPQR